MSSVAVSSLLDMEIKYNRAIEEKTLLEQEIIVKQEVEEENQRLKDECRGEYLACVPYADSRRQQRNHHPPRPTRASHSPYTPCVQLSNVSDARACGANPVSLCLCRLTYDNRLACSQRQVDCDSAIREIVWRRPQAVPPVAQRYTESTRHGLAPGRTHLHSRLISSDQAKHVVACQLWHPCFVSFDRNTKPRWFNHDVGYC